MLTNEELVAQIRNLFKENKEMFFWENINIDYLSDDCLLKNSFIVTKNNKVISYHKFEQIDSFSIENELAFGSNSYIFMNITLKLYYSILKNFNLETTIFKNNKIARKLITKLNFSYQGTFYTFVLENENYNDNKNTKNLIEPIVNNDEIINTNGCYLFYETSLLTDEAIAELFDLANILNYKYIAIFTKRIHPIMNYVPFKESYTYSNRNDLPKKLHRSIQKFTLPKEYKIFNNLKLNIDLKM